MNVSMSMAGQRELAAKLASAPAIARAGTVAGTKAAQRLIIKSVRANLNGAPRWGHRGRSRVYSEPVNHGGRLSGGGQYPGKLTGALRKGVGGKRRPIVVGPAVIGGVGVGGRSNNLKKRGLERKFPYFAPAVRSVEAEIPTAYAAAWGAAIAKIGR